MIGRLAALAAGVAAAAGAAGAAVWARRRAEERTAPVTRFRPPDSERPAATETTAIESAGSDAHAAPAESDVTPIEADAPDDSLQSIRGIGAVSEERLRAIGVTTIAQISAWSEDDVDMVAAQIKVSVERIRREDWVGQARAAARS